MSVRLQERAARVAAIRAKNLLAGRTPAQLAAKDDALRVKWERGFVVPERITLALDSRGLEGPEVDVACEAQEPDVDRWEEGGLYPTWPQLLALGKLTTYPMEFFFLEAGPTVEQSSLRFHYPKGYVEPVLVPVFSPAALAAHFKREGLRPNA